MHQWTESLPISFRVTSLPLGQSYDCPSVSEVTLEDMGKIYCYTPNYNQTQPSVWTLCILIMMYCKYWMVYRWIFHYSDVIMGTMASQITSLTIVYLTVYADQRKHQSSTSLAFVHGIHWVNSPHKWPVTQKMFPFDDAIMCVNMMPYQGSSSELSFHEKASAQLISSCSYICNLFIGLCVVPTLVLVTAIHYAYEIRRCVPKTALVAMDM